VTELYIDERDQATMEEKLTKLPEVEAVFFPGETSSDHEPDRRYADPRART
jgi:hypothetical protein